MEKRLLTTQVSQHMPHELPLLAVNAKLKLEHAPMGHYLDLQFLNLV
jgi:hypothetical protein